MSSDTLVEPSNDEQSQWPEATENYVRGLEERIEALEAENADLTRRLGNICMSIHTCTGDECERPI
jgi:uncharacterized protein YceH (UPF0502 family)